MISFSAIENFVRKIKTCYPSPNLVPSRDIVIQLSWDCRWLSIIGGVKFQFILDELLDYVYIDSFFYANVYFCFRSSTNQIEITVNKEAKVRKFLLSRQKFKFVKLCGHNNNVGCDMLFVLCYTVSRMLLSVLLIYSLDVSMSHKLFPHKDVCEMGKKENGKVSKKIQHYRNDDVLMYTIINSHKLLAKCSKSNRKR